MLGIVDLASQPDLFRLLVHSLVPGIFGHETVKGESVPLLSGPVCFNSLFISAGVFSILCALGSGASVGAIRWLFQVCDGEGHDRGPR